MIEWRFCESLRPKTDLLVMEVADGFTRMENESKAIKPPLAMPMDESIPTGMAKTWIRVPSSDTTNN